MKKALTLFVLLLMSVLSFAQNPKLSYQAVVRDSQNKLVVEQPITVSVTILKADNTSQFEQMINANTNRNGLMSLEIGDETAAWSTINWVGAKIRTAITLPNGSQVVDTSNVNAVPFALQTIRTTDISIPQSNWAETDNSKNTFILNKPSIKDTVNNILTDGNYVTTTMMDERGYLTSDSAVIITMKANIDNNTANITTNTGNIANNANNITTNANAIAAAMDKEKADSTTLAARINALENAAMDCNDVKACIADTLSQYTKTTGLCDVVNTCDLSSNASIANLSTLLQGLSDQMETMNGKMDSLNHLVDSLSNQAPVQTFTCGSYTVDDHEGNTYNTVKIGNQCWTKENMRCTTSPSTGTTILEIPAGDPSYSGKKAYYYNNLVSNADNGFGLLYNWCAAMDTFNTAMGETSTGTSTSDAIGVTFSGNRRGICPQGWHVPSDAEWNQLREYMFTHGEYLCGTLPNDIAKSLASTEYWEIDSLHNCAVGNVLNENNKSGFSALPAGERTNYSYDFRGNTAFFWSATQTNPVSAYYLPISSFGATVILNYNQKNFAHSVRCLRDGGVTGAASANETQLAPTSMSCEDVMNCIGDNLGKLNAKIEAQAHQIDSLLHLADSLSIFHPFACGDSITDADNNKYPTVKIGTQCWMAQNLRTTKKPNGTSLSNTDYYKVIEVDGPMANSDDISNYGYLYKWNIMMNGSDLEGGQGLCPDGWHVPSKTEWETMTSFVKRQPSYLCGNLFYSFVWSLISTTGWERPIDITVANACDENFNGNGTNITGFNAFPAGFYDVLNDFTLYKGMYAEFWSSSSTYDDHNQLNNSPVLLLDSSPNMEIEDKNKDNAYSVRCVRD